MAAGGMHARLHAAAGDHWRKRAAEGKAEGGDGSWAAGWLNSWAAGQLGG